MSSGNNENIDVYRWSGNSKIIKVDVRSDKEERIAYIQAAENTANLHTLRELFRKQGWASSSDKRNGEPVLRLTGFKNENDLIELLQNSGYVENQASIEKSDKRKKAHKGAASSLKANSLRTSGLFYMLGNILFIMSGIKRHDKSQIGTGTFFAIGDSALMAFGGKDDRRQFNSLLKKLKKHLDDHGIEIPEGAAINAELMAKPHGFLETTYDFIHEHINTIKIMAEVLGGAFYFNAGKNQNNTRKQAAGAIIVTGWAATLLVKEKKIDPEEYKKAGTLGKLKMQIQDKPLRIAGWAGLTHNALSTVGAFEERKKELAKPDGNHNYRWDMGGIAAMVTANSLYSISNKVTGGKIDNVGLVDDVYGLAAQILHTLPEKEREAAIVETANFLGQRTEIKDTREKIIRKLNDAVNNLSSNPWFDVDDDKQPASINYREKIRPAAPSDLPIGSNR